MPRRVALFAELFAMPGPLAGIRVLELARILAGPGHEAAVAPAGRMRALAQTGRADEARVLRSEANAALKALPSAAFPAVAHAALIDHAAPEPLKRLRLTWAVLRGRV